MPIARKIKRRVATETKIGQVSVLLSMTPRKLAPKQAASFGWPTKERTKRLSFLFLNLKPG